MSAFAATLVMLHVLDGSIVFVNPEEITMVAPPRGKSERLVPEAGRCTIHMADGKFVTVLEDCETINKLLKGEPIR